MQVDTAGTSVAVRFAKRQKRRRHPTGVDEIVWSLRANGFSSSNRLSMIITGMLVPGFYGGAGAALSRQHVHGAVTLAVGDDGFHHAVFLDAGNEVSGKNGVFCGNAC